METLTLRQLLIGAAWIAFGIGVGFLIIAGIHYTIKYW